MCTFADYGYGVKRLDWAALNGKGFFMGVAGTVLEDRPWLVWRVLL
jgi:hypothetical protein